MSLPTAISIERNSPQSRRFWLRCWMSVCPTRVSIFGRACRAATTRGSRGTCGPDTTLPSCREAIWRVTLKPAILAPDGFEWPWWRRPRNVWRPQGALRPSSRAGYEARGMMTQQLETIINDAWENRANINTAGAAPELRQAVEHVIAELDAGRLRVATRTGVGKWTTHQWIKKAVLLSFRLSDNVIMKSGDLAFYDK